MLQDAIELVSGRVQRRVTRAMLEGSSQESKADVANMELEGSDTEAL